MNEQCVCGAAFETDSKDHEGLARFDEWRVLHRAHRSLWETSMKLQIRRGERPDPPPAPRRSGDKGM